MGKKYPTEREGVNGWTRWIFPEPAGYKIACCDCGLVHDFEFAVVPVEYNKDNSFHFNEEDVETEARVMLRARRNRRATAAKRRHSKP